MMSVGLLVGCGDDGMPTTAATGQPGTMTSVSTSLGTSTSTATDTTASTGEPTGTGSTGNTASTGSTADPTTGMVTVTVGTTTMGTTDAMTTDISTTTTVSTSTDTTSTASSTTDDTSTSDTTGPDTSTSTSTTDVSSTTEDVPCSELNPTVVPVKPNVMLVLDKSGSMLTLWDHDANANTPQVTRWNSLYGVVDQILTAFQTKFNFGMTLFPNKSATTSLNAQGCLVNMNPEVGVQPFAKNAIMNALPTQNNNTIAGGTPTAAGMTTAINHLKTLNQQIPRAVMLITDGAANCGAGLMYPPLFEAYDQSLHTVVGNAWTQDGIPTYVIGIAIQNVNSGNAQDGNPDNINPYVKLNELATAGGKPKPGNEKFYSADNQIELSAALDAIIADATSCVITLNPEPGFPDFTKVKINDNLVPKINDCANQNGWKYVDPAPPYDAIELCGTACDAYKMAGGADVEYYCTPG